MVKKAHAGIWATCALLALDARATIVAKPAGTGTAYSGSPTRVSGTIEAENFDNGGEGVGYHDASAGNAGGVYRQTDVDIAGSASEGGYVVGWISPNEWLAYTVDVASAGVYLFEARVASLGRGGTFHAELGGIDVTGALVVPDTGGWDSWTTISRTVTLGAGVQLMRVVFDTDGTSAVGNLNWIRLAAQPRTTLNTSAGVPTSYSAISDRVARPKPQLPALGPAGFQFTDPTFSSRVLRVTDGQTRPSSVNVSYRTPAASPQMAWSATSTYFYVTSTDGTIVPYAFDASTMKASRIAGTGDGGVTLTFNTEPEFSSVDGNVIYGVSSTSNNRTITRYDFSTRAYSTVLDLDTIVGGLAGTYTGGLVTGGVPTEYLVIGFGGASQDLHHYVLWFPVGNPAARKIIDTTASTLNGARTNIPLNFRLHAVMLDRSGRYVLLCPTAGDSAAPRNASPMYVWDTTTDIITAMTSGGRDGLPAALPGGHAVAGFGYWVNHDCCVSSAWDAGQWELRSLASPLAPWDLVAPVLTPQQVFLSEHPSWNNAQPDALVPVLSGTFRYGNNPTPWRAWDDEIVAVETKATAGTGATVWRFAHHRSNIASDTDPFGMYFWYTPRPNVSPNGRWAIFTSNWEKALGSDSRERAFRQDVFLVELPTATPVQAPKSPTGLRIAQ